MRIVRTIVTVGYTLSATAALAAEGVGQARSVIDSARAKSQAGSRVLEFGTDVFLGDMIETDKVGEAQLLFKDGTRMVVGSNSALVIEQFLFRAGASENKFAVQALGGAFRFISGDAGSDAYSIRTPTGTIGVRGTALDFTVTSNDTKLVVLEGQAELCDDEARNNGSTDDENCAVAVTPCAVLRSDRTEEKVEEVGIEQGRQEVINENFPYVNNDTGLESEFQVAGHGCAQGGLANSAISGSSIPAEAIVIGGIVILGGVVIGTILKGDSNNNTNN